MGDIIDVWAVHHCRSRMTEVITSAKDQEFAR